MLASAQAVRLSLSEYSNAASAAPRGRDWIGLIVFEHVAEEKIREAIEQGVFTGLAGEGRPLPEIDDELTGDDRIGLHLLRSNGFLPDWLELRKQVHDERDAVVAAMRDWTEAIRQFGSRHHPLAIHAGENYRRAATAINAKIDLHNLRCPSIH